MPSPTRQQASRLPIYFANSAAPRSPEFAVGFAATAAHAQRLAAAFERARPSSLVHHGFHVTACQPTNFETMTPQPYFTYGVGREVGTTSAPRTQRPV